MPSLWKRIAFSVASALCIVSVVLLVVALSTERWVTGRILCKTGVVIVNATSTELDQFRGHIYYGLFQGGKTKNCGLGNRRNKIYSKMIACLYLKSFSSSADCFSLYSQSITSKVFV